MSAGERIEMTVKMRVTESQALALQAMFRHWNMLASIGSSRFIGFYVDGDGNFKPKCEVSLSREIHPLTPELEAAARASDDGHFKVDFDFDGVAWKLRELRGER